MSLKDKNHIVYVVKCICLKNGYFKKSISRYGFMTRTGAERCLSRMRSRSDVIEAFIDG